MSLLTRIRSPTAQGVAYSSLTPLPALAHVLHSRSLPSVVYAQPELPKLDFRLPPARGSSPTTILQSPFVPYEHRWCPGVPSSRTPRLRMNGLVHSSVRTRPVFFQTSGPRGPSRFQIPGSRFWILDCTHHIDRDPVVAHTRPNALHISSRTWAHPAAVCHAHPSYLGRCVVSVSSDVHPARACVQLCGRHSLWPR